VEDETKREKRSKGAGGNSLQRW